MKTQRNQVEVVWNHSQCINPTLCRMLQNNEIGGKYSYNCNFV